MASQNSLQSFALFPLLPIELRHKIWVHAVDSLPSRILDLHRTIPTFVPHYPLPTLLQTTHESRSVTLRRYLPWPKPRRAPASFESGVTFVQSPIPKHNRDDCSWIYVSPTTDIFILRLRQLLWKEDDESIQQPKEEIYRRMHRIAMHKNDWQRHLWQIYTRRNGGGMLGSEEQLFSRFMALETMHILLCGEEVKVQEDLWYKDVTKDKAIMLDYLGSFSSNVVLMTGDEALGEVKDRHEGWKVPVLRVVHLE